MNSSVRFVLAEAALQTDVLRYLQRPGFDLSRQNIPNMSTEQLEEVVRLLEVVAPDAAAGATQSIPDENTTREDFMSQGIPHEISQHLSVIHLARQIHTIIVLRVAHP